MKNQFDKFPGTRFMGSKYRLVNHIWDIAKEFNFDTFLDAFSGSCVVSYYFKTKNKKVISNDYMVFTSLIAKALIENNNVKLNPKDLDILLSNNNDNNFISKTFNNLYFTDEENKLLDNIRTNIDKLKNEYKKSIAISALCRSCIKKRPRGVFTYIGYRYDDGRLDLKKSLKDHFIESVNLINNAVFDNNKKNIALNKDIIDLEINTDMVYIDPPYYSPLSDNEYTRRYHFVEGLSRYWQGLEIQKNTKTKKFKKYHSLFGTKSGTYRAFNSLFEKYNNSILLISYSSNSIPSKNEMFELIKKYKSNIKVFQIDHRYSFGNQNHKINNDKNKVKEYIFVGF